MSCRTLADIYPAKNEKLIIINFKYTEIHIIYAQRLDNFMTNFFMLLPLLDSGDFQRISPLENLSYIPTNNTGKKTLIHMLMQCFATLTNQRWAKCYSNNEDKALHNLRVTNFIFIQIKNVFIFYLYK